MGTVALEGGGFQDIEGNPLVNGALEFDLSDPCVDSATGTIQICNIYEYRVPLDVNGNIVGGNLIWTNDSMTNVRTLKQDTFYLVRAYSANGEITWGPNAIVITNINPFNIGFLIPPIPV